MKECQSSLFYLYEKQNVEQGSENMACPAWGDSTGSVALSVETEPGFL